MFSFKNKYFLIIESIKDLNLRNIKLINKYIIIYRNKGKIENIEELIKFCGKGFEKAFEVLGEVAMISLMNDPNVIKSLEEWVNYVSEDFIKKIN